MAELTTWVEKNKHRTWNFEGKIPGEQLTLEIKYLEFSLDTRDMTVWRLGTSGRAMLDKAFHAREAGKP